ncbi:MAG: class I SAM-dependent methyltransferase [Phycisphaeraceae bacterium]
MEDSSRPQRRRRRLPPEAAKSDFAARNPDGTRKQPGGPSARSQQRPPTDWGPVAEWYDELVGDEGSEYHREVILPGVLRMLSIHKGERVLDVACGQGVLCRQLAAKGANVTGVDAARALIDLAKKRSAPRDEDDPTIDFRLLDVRTLVNVAEFKEQFHAAACILAIQNIDTLRPVFDGMAASLVNDGAGRVVIVLNHPAYRSPQATSWGWDERAKVQYRRVDRYLLPRKHPIVTHPGKDPTRYTWSFHRPLGTYVKALRQAGLLVEAIEEWASHKHSDSGPRAKAENDARKEIPLFMAIKARKVPGLGVSA